MSQDQSKVFHGPFTANFDATTGAGTVTVTGSNKDSVKVDIQTKVAVEPLVDGSAIRDQSGKLLTMEMTVDEMVAADMDLIETLNAGATPGIRIQFTNMPAGTDLLSILEQGLKVFVDIVNFKPVIKAFVEVPAGTTFATLFQIA